MPTGTQHADLTSIHQAAYVGSSDPGAVGPGKFWVDESASRPILKIRNGADTAWLVEGDSVFGAVVTIDSDTTINGTERAIIAGDSGGPVNITFPAVAGRSGVPIVVFAAYAGVTLIAHSGDTINNVGSYAMAVGECLLVVGDAPDTDWARFSEKPWVNLGICTIDASETAIAHGLTYTPTDVIFTAYDTVDGFGRTSTPFDSTNIYAIATRGGDTAIVYVR